MSYYRFTRKQEKSTTVLGLEAEMHVMKRDGFCYGCGGEVEKGSTVYRIHLLAGKQPHIHLCGECQALIYRDIESKHD